MKKLNTSILASGLMLVALSGNTFGEAGISYNTAGKPADVTANVKFKITIPQIMILRVGDWADSVNTVEWKYAFGTNTNLTSPTENAGATEAQWNETVTAPLSTATDDEAASDKAGDGALKVAAFANTGANLNLVATTVSDFVSTTPVTGAVQPHLSEITATNANSSIGHPLLVNTAAASSAAPVVLTAINGIVRATDTWTYTYTPLAGAIPTGGEYNAEVSYTLTSL